MSTLEASESLCKRLMKKPPMTRRQAEKAGMEFYKDKFDNICHISTEVVIWHFEKTQEAKKAIKTYQIIGL